MALKPFTVTQVSEFISKLFKTEPLLRPVVVTGEVSYVNFHSNGNIYFSIKDQKSKLDCVIFTNRIDDKALKLEPGLEVILMGNVESFAAQSKYSLWVNSVEIAGEGDQAKAFEELKKKLNQEGLFDKEHKLPLPEYPKHIAIVTSATGAAVEDIIKIITSITRMVDLTVFPVLVQGPSAHKEMINALDVINRDFYNDIDLIILGRGGGSVEDLAAFNDEGLARAIYASKIPIISGVGHEIDVSISDFVADYRAETPTAAAQIAVASYGDLIRQMDDCIESLNQYLGNKLMQAEFDMDSRISNIQVSIRNLIDNFENEIEKQKIILDENNPKTILDKGYALVSDEVGKPITSKSKIVKNQIYSISFGDGDAKVKGE